MTKVPSSQVPTDHFCILTLGRVGSGCENDNGNDEPLASHSSRWGRSFVIALLQPTVTPFLRAAFD